MHITNIELHNFKKIKDFKREFSGGVYLLTGENEVGKSTILSAIASLLTGDRNSNLLTKGEQKGFAKMTVENGEESYAVSLKYTEKNPRGTLSIETSTGFQSDNKSMLQKVFQYEDFDANEFVNWSNTAEGKRKQVAMVKSLLPEDIQVEIEEIDASVAQIKESRKEKNADFKSLKAIVDRKRVSLDEFKDGNPEIIDTTSLENEKIEATLKNEKIKGALLRMKDREKSLEHFNSNTKLEESRYDESIDSLKSQLMDAENRKKVYMNGREDERKKLLQLQNDAELWLSENKEISVAEITAKIEQAKEVNLKVSKAKEFIAAKSEADEIEKVLGKISDEIEAKASRRSKLIKGSQVPIDGLSFTEEGLFLNGIPFAPNEVSTSQEMEVAAKLIMAKNPKVKVFKIAQGESLGTDRLKAIVDFAEKNGYQGFIEEVHRGQQDLIIEEYKEA